MAYLFEICHTLFIVVVDSPSPSPSDPIVKQEPGTQPSDSQTPPQHATQRERQKREREQRPQLPGKYMLVDVLYCIVVRMYTFCCHCLIRVSYLKSFFYACSFVV